MAKEAATLDLMLPPRDPDMPAYVWLYQALRSQILEGRLRPGARLPATRDLAAQYNLSRGTIVTAFDQLKSEGYTKGTVGSGTYVSKVLPDDLLRVTGPAGTASSQEAQRRRRLSGYGSRLTPFPVFENRRSTAFRSNVPALDLFPATLWAQLAARRFRRASTAMLLGCGPMGYQPLRVAISDYLAASRGVKCAPEQVAIVSGTQEAFDLTARLFLNPGDRVCMEDPGYLGASIVLQAIGASIEGLPLDHDGMQLPPDRLKGSRLIYVTPGHQFPTGITMSLARRLELIEAAHHCGALIFEDDYDSEYRYSGRPVPALQGLDRYRQVVFAGSFSKVLFPALRLGYLVVPPDLVGVVETALSVTRRHAPIWEQAVLCDFIVDGHFGRHLRRMRAVYAERLAVLLASAHQRLQGLLEISPVEAGLQTAGWLAEGVDSEAAAQAAAVRNVEVTPLRRYSLGGFARDGLQLGFAAVDPREIRRGVRELAIALESLAREKGQR